LSKNTDDAFLKALEEAMTAEAEIRNEGYTYVDGNGHCDPDLPFCEYMSGEAKAEAKAVAVARSLTCIR
jgi:hypothetical protein